MTVLTIPVGPADLTPEWLTAALSHRGPAAHVTDARWERVGQDYGLTGLIGRINLRYERDVQGWPASCIAKLPLAPDDSASAYRRRQERDPLLADRLLRPLPARSPVLSRDPRRLRSPALLRSHQRR